MSAGGRGRAGAGGGRAGTDVGGRWQHGRVTWDFEAPLWLWDARQADAWTFVSLPPDVADDVLDAGGAVTRGFGSLRVEVTVGATTWRTSVFPSKGLATYVLPIKRVVRRAEGLAEGDTARVRLRLVDI